MNSSRVGFSAKATFIVADLGLGSDMIWMMSRATSRL